MAQEKITLTDPQDLAFARIAQGAKVRKTILSSGLLTPDVEMTIVGNDLVETVR